MKIIKTVAELQKITQAFRERKTIGLVPTMGALHEGHASLAANCRKKCDVAIASIFVNPTQFNNKADLTNYPRCEEKDLEILQNLGVDIVFTPSEKEIYPEPDTRTFCFGEMERVMEGAFRPGHFNGVAQIVSRLFEYCKPHYAFFGEKDFQQLAIIRELVKKQHYPIEIIACPTVREKDGLAMSSRNQNLSPEMRKIAPVIAKTLFAAKEKMQNTDVLSLKNWITHEINMEGLKTEYVDVVNARTLQPIEHWDEAEFVQLCVAAWAESVRLIDNIALK